MKNTPIKPRGRLTNKKTHRDLSPTITRKSSHDTPEGQSSSKPRRSNRIALVSRDPTTTLHHRRNQRATCIRDARTPRLGRLPYHRGRRQGHPNRSGVNKILKAKPAATAIMSISSSSRPTTSSHNTHSFAVSARHCATAPHASTLPPLDANYPRRPRRGGGGSPALPTLIGLRPPTCPDDSEERERKEKAQGSAANFLLVARKSDAGEALATLPNASYFAPNRDRASLWNCGRPC
jgi:hypothetical protein